MDGRTASPARTRGAYVLCRSGPATRVEGCRARSPDGRVGRLAVFVEVLFERLGSVVSGACEHEHRVARRLLAGAGLDVEATVAYLRENGGACDYEVLLNVDVEDDRLPLVWCRQE
jgi:Protein of unknown function (DUF2695)